MPIITNLRESAGISADSAFILKSGLAKLYSPPFVETHGSCVRFYNVYYKPNHMQDA